LNIFNLIVSKIKNFSIIAIIFMPCVVEAIPFNKTEVSAEFMGSNLLVFKVMLKDINQTIKISVIGVDGLFSYVKGGDEVFPGLYSPFFSASPAGETMIGNDPKESDTGSNKSSNNCVVYFIILLPFLLLWYAILKGKDLLGNVIVLCKRHKYLKWLAYDIDIWSE
jgi:hypothetical protein